MSWRATAHLKELTHAPNGDAITRSEKLLLLIIADYYNDEKLCAWASIPTLAKNSLLSERRVQQVSRTAEAKGILKVTHRSGKSNVYRLPTLDELPGGETIAGVKSPTPGGEISSQGVKHVSPSGVKPASPKHVFEQPVLEQTEEHTPARAQESVCVGNGRGSKFPDEVLHAYAKDQKGAISPAAIFTNMQDGRGDVLVQEWKDAQEAKAKVEEKPDRAPELPGEEAPELLAEFLAAIKERVNPATYERWFQPIRVARITDGVINIRGPSLEGCQWIAGSYPVEIAEALEAIGLQEYEARFVV